MKCRFGTGYMLALIGKDSTCRYIPYHSSITCFTYMQFAMQHSFDEICNMKKATGTQYGTVIQSIKTTNK